MRAEGLRAVEYDAHAHRHGGPQLEAPPREALAFPRRRQRRRADGRRALRAGARARLSTGPRGRPLTPIVIAAWVGPARGFLFPFLVTFNSLRIAVSIKSSRPLSIKQSLTTIVKY